MKKLLLSLVIAATLVSCNGSGKPHPTGDAEKDAKAYMEYAIKSAEAIQSEKDMAKFEKEMLGLRQEFDTYMEKNPVYKTAFLAQGDAEEADWESLAFFGTLALIDCKCSGDGRAGDVRIQHAHQGHIRQIQALGNHLRAKEHRHPLLLEAAEDFFVGIHRIDRIRIHAGDLRLRQQGFQLLLGLLGSGAEACKVGRAAARTVLRGSHFIAAVMTF